jgi:galactokinase
MFIPGRIEFLGKHTDYCGGRSIVCAIDRGFHLSIAYSDFHTLRLINRDTGEDVSLDLDDPKPPPAHWSKYAAEVVKRLGSNFPGMLRGATLAFRSDLPPAAGLSSSSALIIMVFGALAGTSGIGISKIYDANIEDSFELAEYLSCIENGRTFNGLAGSKGVGTLGGSQDHAAITLSAEGYLHLFAYSPLYEEDDFMFPDDRCFVVASSGVVAEKTGAALERYNRLSKMVSAIVERYADDRTLAQLIDDIGIDALKEDLAADDIGEFSSGELLERVEQFYVENYQIIPQAAELLTAGRIDEIGELLDLSQRNAETLLRNQTPETIFLHRSARELGAFGASAFGAGFGGSVYAIVEKDGSDEFLNKWRNKYQARFSHRRSEFFTTEPSVLDMTPEDES